MSNSQNTSGMLSGNSKMNLWHGGTRIRQEEVFPEHRLMAAISCYDETNGL